MQVGMHLACSGTERERKADAGDRGGQVARVRKRWLAWDLVGQTMVRTLPATSQGAGRQGEQDTRKDVT